MVPSYRVSIFASRMYCSIGYSCRKPEPPKVCSDSVPSSTHARSEPTPFTIGSSRSLRRAASCAGEPSAKVSSPVARNSWSTVSCWLAVNSTSARRPSAYAFCSISERRTSGWWVMVTRGASFAGVVMSAPCTRSLAYSSAFR